MDDRQQGSGLTWLEARPCTRGYGMTAYAGNQTTGKEILTGYHWKQEIDRWLVPKIGAAKCKRPVEDFAFSGWGVNENAAHFKQENSLPSEIWVGTSGKQLPLNHNSR